MSAGALAADLAACGRRQAAAWGYELLQLLSGEPGDRIARQLLAWREELPEAHPPPSLPGEVTPSPAEVYAPFEDGLTRWCAGVADLGALSRAIRESGWRGLLVLTGLRITAATVVDARAIPPERAALLAAAGKPASGELNVAARALAKHAARGDAFWGVERGGPGERSARALELVGRIVDERTWWNAFEHGEHGLVLEARVKSGHGARWGDGGRTLIGLLDPFSGE